MSLNCESSKSGKCSFNPLWRFEASMGELAMEGASDANRCDHVAPETKLKGGRGIAEGCTQSYNMSTGYDTGHNLIFLVHLPPTFVHSWKYLETPKSVISERPKLWNNKLSSFIPLIFHFLHLDHSLLFIDFCLLGDSFFFSRSWIHCDGHHCVISGCHQK